MPFIKTIEETEAEGELKAYYDAQLEKSGSIGNIHKIYSIKPPLMMAYREFSRAVTFGATSLGRRKEEILAVAISSMFKCKY
jgi:hypothetical protein